MHCSAAVLPSHTNAIPVEHKASHQEYLGPRVLMVVFKQLAVRVGHHAAVNARDIKQLSVVAAVAVHLLNTPGTDILFSDSCK